METFHFLIEIVTFDYFEVFTGPCAPLRAAMREVGLRVGPCVDIQMHQAWDANQDKFLHWMVELIRLGRVWYIHLGPPCTTFSIA